MTGLEARSSIAVIPMKTHATLVEFTPEKSATYIYIVAYELNPAKLWQGFFGRRNILITSWMHVRLYKTDYGAGTSLRYVHPMRSFIDGQVILMEGAPIPGDPNHEKGGENHNSWYVDGQM